MQAGPRTKRSAVAADLTHEARWPALVAVIAVVGLSIALAPGLSIGPLWLFPAIVGGLAVPTVTFHRQRRHRIDRALGFTLTVVITLELIASVFRLVLALPAHRESAGALLISATSIWTTNILVFALWYWRLDAGGPHAREAMPRHEGGAFLFPQMADTGTRDAEADGWRPNFLDYLFLAFNTSTAFSPTDTPVLARWAKALMMLQSILSLAVLALLAGRAVNIF